MSHSLSLLEDGVQGYHAQNASREEIGGILMHSTSRVVHFKCDTLPSGGDLVLQWVLVSVFFFLFFSHDMLSFVGDLVVQWVLDVSLFFFLFFVKKM